MSKFKLSWLESSQEQPEGARTEPPKAPSVSFGSTPPAHIQPLKRPEWDDQKVFNTIQSSGLIRIWSRVLHEWVLWIRDEGVRLRASQKFPQLVSYTLDELEHLVRIRSEVHLRAIHETKKVFGSAARITGSEKVEAVEVGV
jgi:hypothetical protein